MLGGNDTWSSVNEKKAWQNSATLANKQVSERYAFGFTFSNSAMNAFGPPGM
jgi:hypothetical protein